MTKIYEDMAIEDELEQSIEEDPDMYIYNDFAEEIEEDEE